MNIANKITIFRILLTPLFITFILYSKWDLALLVFFMAAISDAVDGYVAREFSQRTELGRILDPIADKLLILSAYICFSVTPNLPIHLRLPVYVPIIIISRDAIIVLGVLITFFVKKELEIKPTMIGKVTTFFQMATVIAILLKTPVSPVLWNITIALTVASGTDYIVRGSRFLNEK